MTTNSQQVDPWQVDIERIEVLPGPQGTLHGSSSQTGALRIITNKPNHDGVSGQIDAGAASTKYGEPQLRPQWPSQYAGYRQPVGAARRGVLLPGRWLCRQCARADLAGQYDNADVAEDDFNDYAVYGGRVAALWDVSDRWSVLATVIGQFSETEGSWSSDPNLGKFKITKFLDEYRDDDWHQMAMTITGDLGFAEFSATTASFDRDIAYEWDNTLYEQYNAYAKPGTLYDRRYMVGMQFNDQQQERFSQEVRLTSTTASRLQWMIGGILRGRIRTNGSTAPRSTVSWTRRLGSRQPVRLCLLRELCQHPVPAAAHRRHLFQRISPQGEAVGVLQRGNL